MAEGARLESVYTGNRIVGSNPTPSATQFRNPLCGLAVRLEIKWESAVPRVDPLYFYVDYWGKLLSTGPFSPELCTFVAVYGL